MDTRFLCDLGQSAFASLGLSFLRLKMAELDSEMAYMCDPSMPRAGITNHDSVFLRAGFSLRSLLYTALVLEGPC